MDKHNLSDCYLFAVIFVFVNQLALLCTTIYRRVGCFVTTFLFRWSSIGDGDYKWQCWWQLKMHLIFDNLVKWSCFPGFWLHQADQGEQKTKLWTRLPDWRVSFNHSFIFNIQTTQCKDSKIESTDYYLIYFILKILLKISMTTIVIFWDRGTAIKTKSNS